MSACQARVRDGWVRSGGRRWRQQVLPGFRACARQAKSGSDYCHQHELVYGTTSKLSGKPWVLA